MSAELCGGLRRLRGIKKEKLYIWGKKTNFPLRNEVITSKYMGYGLKICHLKIGKKKKEDRYQ